MFTAATGTSYQTEEDKERHKWSNIATYDKLTTQLLFSPDNGLLMADIEQLCRVKINQIRLSKRVLWEGLPNMLWTNKGNARYDTAKCLSGSFAEMLTWVYFRLLYPSSIIRMSISEQEQYKSHDWDIVVDNMGVQSKVIRCYWDGMVKIPTYFKNIRADFISLVEIANNQLWVIPMPVLVYMMSNKQVTVHNNFSCIGIHIQELHDICIMDDNCKFFDTSHLYINSKDDH